jgi:polyhydroxybutyrate depolymerase
MRSQFFQVAVLTVVGSCSRPAPRSGPPALAVPAEQRYDPPGGERRPLLVVLHGLGSSGKQMFDALGLRAYGERSRSHVLAPDGTVDSHGRRFWNAVPECCNFDARPLDDVARITALIDTVVATGTVDERRIQVVGISNGGFMAHRLGCRLGNRLAAIVSIAGAAPLDASEPCVLAPPLAVLEIHGDADEKVPYAGGHLFGRPEMPRHRSVLDTLALWGKRLGCSGPLAASGERDLVPSLPGAETEARTFTTCASGSAALWTIHGGGHIPPLGRTMSALEPYLAEHHR